VSRVRVLGIAALVGAGGVLPIVPALAATRPPGYTRVTGAVQPAPAQSYVLPAIAVCPSGTVVWGGGVLLTGGEPGPDQSTASSFPSGSGQWLGQYSNASENPITVAANAVCAAKPAGYRIVHSTVASAPGVQAGATAVCPTGLVVLGGGAQTTADGPGSWLTLLGPTSATKFRAVNWNGAGAPETLIVYAICAQKPAGYRIVTSSTTDSGAPDTVNAGTVCPAGSVVVSGGVLPSSPSPLVWLGGEESDGAHEWLSEVVNTATGTPVSLVFRAVCAA
jgi:hypothetical protein